VATLPPDTRAVGTPDPAGDNNSIVDCLVTITGAAAGGGAVTAQQTLNTLAAAVTTGQYLRGNGTNVQMSAIQAADVPNLINGSWLPGSGGSGYLGWNSDPAYGSGGGLTVAGTVYLQRLNFHAATTVTNLIYWVPTLGAGTSTGTFVGLYNSSGTRLTVSSDLATTFNASGTAGAVVCPLGAAQAMSAGTFAWAACVFNLATTQPTLLRQQNTAANVNGGLTAANFRWATNGTGQTSLPSSITPSSNATTAFTFVAGWT
jgi:hypothetical protein